MAVQPGESMGYASAGNVKAVIGRFRDTNLPTPLTVESIQRVGVSESLAPRTVQTFKLLGLIDDEGKPTEQFERLRRVPTPEFKPALVEVLRTAYAPVFEIVEPAGATYQEVQDAFRTFKPEGQRDRMVALFLGMLEYAEYSDDLPSAGRGAGAISRNVTTGSAPHVRKGKSKDKPTSPSRASRNGAGESGPSGPSAPPVTPPPHDDGKTFVVQLGDAGTVTLTAELDMWLLDDEDMEFFVDLRKRVRAHQAKHQTPLADQGAAANDEIPEERVS